jgi:BON domain
MYEKSRTSRILSHLLIATSVLTLGCSRRTNIEQELVWQVQNGLRSDSRLTMARLQVTCAKGIITLHGYVANNRQRIAAVQDATHIKGVNVVIDDLRFVDSSRLVVMVTKTSAPVVPGAERRRSRSSEEVFSSDGLDSRDFRPSPVNITTYGSERTATSAPDGLLIDSMSPTVKTGASSASVHLDTTLSDAPEQTTLPYGSELVVRLTESIGSDVNEKGDTFLASLASPLRIGDRVVVPEGAALQGKVLAVQDAGRFSGKSLLRVELSRLRYNGKTYDLRTNQYSQYGPSQGDQSVLTIAGGAGLGGILGAIVGGGKGAAIGAIVGAGAGTGLRAASKGTAVYLPAESTFNLRLGAPLTVMPCSTLQRTRNPGEDLSANPFSTDFHPFLKRRADSSDRQSVRP